MVGGDDGESVPLGVGEEVGAFASSSGVGWDVGSDVGALGASDDVGVDVG